MSTGRRFSCGLSDGSRGYFMAEGRSDDCLQAAIATVLQVTPAQVPDLRLDERLMGGEPVAEIMERGVSALESWASDRAFGSSCAMLRRRGLIGGSASVRDRARSRTTVW